MAPADENETAARGADAVPGTGAPLPLAGIKVVDFSRLLPGPWCTQMLADLGAHVVKVEQKGLGDPSRHNPPLYRRDSVYFRSVNGGKKAIALDLSRASGRAVAGRLLAWADVVVESFRPSVAARLGVDHASAQRLNPRVVYCSISGFGQTGPLAHVPGHDLLIQAMGGILRPADGAHGATLPHFQAGDYAAATMSCIAILAGLMRRERTGLGCNADVAMLDSLMHMSNISLLPGLARLAGAPGEPGLEVWGANPRYAIYPTADGGHVAVSLLEARLWRAFCEEIGRPDLVRADETPQDRHSSHGAHAALYREAIAAFCAAHTRAAIVERMLSRAIPVMPVLSPEEALAHPNVAARDIAAVVEDAREERVTELRNPLRPAGLAAPRRTSAPTMAADAQAILAMLGYGDAEIGRLAREEAV